MADLGGDAFRTLASLYTSNEAKALAFVVDAVPKAAATGAALGCAVFFLNRHCRGVGRLLERFLYYATVLAAAVASWLVSTTPAEVNSKNSKRGNGFFGTPKPVPVTRPRVPGLIALQARYLGAAEVNEVVAEAHIFALLVLCLCLPALTVLVLLQWMFGSTPAKHVATSGMNGTAKAAKKAPVDVKAIKPYPKASFRAYFDEFAKEIEAELAPTFEMPSEAVAYVRRVIHYNVPHGKLNRGLAVVDCARIIRAAGCTGGEQDGELDMRRVCALGWCVEWMQAAFLVADDVMDDSLTRRGQACWFRVPEVGVVAINDSWLLLSQVNRILATYFLPNNALGNALAADLEKYRLLVDLFAKVAYQTELGQMLDLTTQPPGKQLDLTLFTLERYKLIVRYKTAYYTFYLPIALGMIVNGVTGAKALSGARNICMMMGEYFQIQDDFLDCYGDPEVIGKVGTDIQDSKCSWLVVQALARASPKQRKTIKANYGKNDPKCIQKVKGVYSELNLEEIFATYEEKTYMQTCDAIDEICKSGVVPRETFQMVLGKIYKRKA